MIVEVSLPQTYILKRIFRCHNLILFMKANCWKLIMAYKLFFVHLFNLNNNAIKLATLRHNNTILLSL